MPQNAPATRVDAQHVNRMNDCSATQPESRFPRTEIMAGAPSPVSSAGWPMKI